MKFLSENIFIKVITVILMIAIITSTVYTLTPIPKAQADFSECLAQFGEILGISEAEKADSAEISVPTDSVGSIASEGETSGSSFGDFYKNCIEEAIVLPLVKMMLAQMTQDIVAWINSGFNGKPTFMTNVGGWMQKLGDQVAGGFLSEIAGSNLCSPFKSQIQLTLAVSYGLNRRRADGTSDFNNISQCTLSGIVKNVDAFMKDFNQGGWAGWFTMTMNPQNNQFGAFLEAKAELDDRISAKTSIEAQKLNWGQGFLSFEKCDDGTITWGGTSDKDTGVTLVSGSADDISTDGGDNTSSDSGGADRGNCRIQTPGKVIEDQLASTFGEPMQQLGLADDFDKIANAMFDQLFKKFISGPDGLLGSMSKGRPLNDIESKFNTSYVSKGKADAQADNSELDSYHTSDASGSDPDNSNPKQNVALNTHVYLDPGRRDVTTSALVDGNKTNVTQNGTGDKTYDGAKTDKGTSTNPYMEIHLKQDYTLGKFEIYQRHDLPQGANPKATLHLEVLDKDRHTVWTSNSYAQDFKNDIEIFAPNDGTPSNKVPKGQYVRIVSDTTAALYIAELEAYPYAKPRITLKGTASVNLKVGDTYNEPGYTALDNQGSDISSSVTTDKTVDTSRTGKTIVTYSATDSNGAVGTKKRTIFVTK